MDAFILAAGLGTRLRPLTDRIPKALVPLAGVPMLERVARRLIAAGADRLIVNVHHYPEQIVRFLQDARGFGVPWLVSIEAEGPLDTGGALLHARDLIRRETPFYLHNVDVLAEFPLEALYQAHLRSHAAATVAVSARGSRRGLIFGPEGLAGRYDDARVWRASASGDTGTGGRGDTESGAEGQAATPRQGDAGSLAGEEQRLAFGGVHVISPRLLDRIEETGVFSILDLYLRLAGEGEKIMPYRIDGYAWFDIGTPEKLAAADAACQAGLAGPANDAVSPAVPASDPPPQVPERRQRP